MSHDILYPLRKLHGQVHERRLEIEKDLRQKAVLRTSMCHSVFLVGTPIHPNVGDSAIVLAEIMFLKKILPRSLKLIELTDDVFCKYKKLAERSIVENGKLPVFWHGGGNMGDMWIEQEVLRREAFSLLRGKRIISFPQTIYYSDTASGKKHAKESVPYYNGRIELTLTARERRSFEIMKALYPDTDLYLIPDIVLSSCAEDYGVQPQQREDVLMCLRNDAEKTIPDEFWNTLKERVGKFGQNCHVIDMEADEAIISMETRDEIVRKKMQEFCNARMVITDRLHGMVFAALTGTPCIVFRNYNHKVKSTFDWISYLPYIRYAETMEEAVLCVPELLSMEDCKYDNAPLMPYFDKLKAIILEACE